MGQKLTVQQALEQGFTHWAFKSDEPVMRKLKNITPGSFEQAADDETPIILVNPKGYKYTISADTLAELVVEYLVNQDEVADEDGELCDLAAEADFKPLAADINARLAKKTYYDLSDIELIP